MTHSSRRTIRLFGLICFSALQWQDSRFVFAADEAVSPFRPRTDVNAARDAQALREHLNQAKDSKGPINPFGEYLQRDAIAVQNKLDRDLEAESKPSIDPATAKKLKQAMDGRTSPQTSSKGIAILPGPRHILFQQSNDQDLSPSLASRDQFVPARYVSDIEANVSPTVAGPVTFASANIPISSTPYGVIANYQSGPELPGLSGGIPSNVSPFGAGVGQPTMPPPMMPQPTMAQPYSMPPPGAYTQPYVPVPTNTVPITNAPISGVPNYGVPGYATPGISPNTAPVLTGPLPTYTTPTIPIASTPGLSNGTYPGGTTTSAPTLQPGLAQPGSVLTTPQPYYIPSQTAPVSNPGAIMPPPNSTLAPSSGLVGGSRTRGSVGGAVNGLPFVSDPPCQFDAKYMVSPTVYRQAVDPCATPSRGAPNSYASAPYGASGGSPFSYVPPTMMPYNYRNPPYPMILGFGQKLDRAYLSRGIVGQPTAYVDGQPVRNFLRYVFP
jgi:hypothetical protein